MPIKITLLIAAVLGPEIVIFAPVVVVEHEAVPPAVLLVEKAVPGRQHQIIVHQRPGARSRDRLIGIGAPVLARYERICFDKELINVPGKPTAAFICPGHPLLDSALDLTLERHRDDGR